MLAIAHQSDEMLFDVPPHGAPAEKRHRPWRSTLPVMRSFPRLAAECADEPVVEARLEEEPERWDGMA